MQIYLAVTPGDFRDASRFTRSFSHVAYRIGPESTLLRHNLLLQTKGGLLSLSDHDAPVVSDPELLTQSVIRECSRRSYVGMVLDFEKQPRKDLREFAAALVQKRGRLGLFVPESYMDSAPSAAPMICTALSGGNYAQWMNEAAARFGVGKFALDVERLTMDFPLPSPTGQGQPLSREAFSHLMEKESPTVFFSESLCARYFTYTRDGKSHFVLYDDADTLSRKLHLGQTIGAGAAFFQYPEVRDLLPALFRK